MINIRFITYIIRPLIYFTFIFEIVIRNIVKIKLVYLEMLLIVSISVCMCVCVFDTLVKSTADRFKPLSIAPRIRVRPKEFSFP